MVCKKEYEVRLVLKIFLFFSFAKSFMRAQYSFRLVSIFGLIIELYHVIKRRSMINPFADGVISGFCSSYGVLSLFNYFVCAFKEPLWYAYSLAPIPPYVFAVRKHPSQRSAIQLR